MSVCAYCRKRRAVNQDHVVPKSVAKRYELPMHLAKTVGSCFECNMRKGARKLVPPSWEKHLTELNFWVPGAWRVWDGDPKSPAFREVHL